MTKWDDAIINQVRVWALEGHSGSQIAILLSDKYGQSYTRNAVLGKLHRVKIRLCKKQSGCARKARPRVTRRPQQPKPEAYIPPIDTIIPLNGTGLPFVDAANCNCHFVIGTQMVCGLATHAHGFCIGHYLHCYQVANDN